MAQEVKHTPGPWELVSLSGYGAPFSIRMAYHSDNPNAPKTHYGVQSVRRREDACLIAAAPDLLGACKHALLLLEPFDSPDLSLGLGSEALAPLRAAIAKAEGR